MEALSCFLRRAREGGFFTGFKVNGRDGEGLKLSHLLFPDDTLVFREASHVQMTHFSWLLMWFEAISGLKINLTKSKLIPIDRVENLEKLAFEVGLKVGVLPTTYLGLPLGAPHNSLVAWDRVEERFHKKMALCKRQYISKGGILTLIRSMLASLPIYFMSLLQMSRLVCLRLEKIQKDFLWGSGTLEGKPHLDKRKGGFRSQVPSFAQQSPPM